MNFYILLVVLAQYAQPTVAVAPLDDLRGEVRWSDAAYNWTEVDCQTLTTQVMVALSKSRAFNVLEGESLAKLADRMKELKSPGIATKNMDRSKLLGSSFLVYGEVTDFSAETVEKHRPYSSQVVKESTIALSVVFKVVTVESGSLVFSESVVTKHKGRDPVNQVVDQAKVKAALAFTEKMMAELFPITVVESMGENVVLTLAPGPNYKVGAVLRVYQLGKELISPTTEEYLGQEETFCGRVEIVEVLPKVAKAKIIEKATTPIARGCICRFEEVSRR